MDFWESFWLMIRWIFWSFVFIAYLMILFHIIVDIVRDTTMRGLVKAVWFLFLRSSRSSRHSSTSSLVATG